MHKMCSPLIWCSLRFAVGSVAAIVARNEFGTAVLMAISSGFLPLVSPLPHTYFSFMLAIAVFNSCDLGTSAICHLSLNRLFGTLQFLSLLLCSAPLSKCMYTSYFIANVFFNWFNSWGFASVAGTRRHMLPVWFVHFFYSVCI